MVFQSFICSRVSPVYATYGFDFDGRSAYHASLAIGLVATATTIAPVDGEDAYDAMDKDGIVPDSDDAEQFVSGNSTDI